MNNSGKIAEWRRVYKVRTRYTVSVEKIEYVAAESLDDALDEQKLEKELSKHCSEPPLKLSRPGRSSEAKFEVVDGEATTPGEPLEEDWETTSIPWREDAGCCDIDGLWEDQLAADMARIVFSPESLPDTCSNCEENVGDGWKAGFVGDEISIECGNCYWVLAKGKRLDRKNGATP